MIGKAGGLARARALSPDRRRSIARRAARARWKKSSKLVPIAEIRRQVIRALSDREAAAYLFGSYAKREATPDSDVDLMVVVRSPADWYQETAVLRARLDFGRPIDLIVVDSDTFEAWKDEPGQVTYEASKTGIRLV